MNYRLKMDMTTVETYAHIQVYHISIVVAMEEIWVREQLVSRTDKLVKSPISLVRKEIVDIPVNN